MSVQLVVNTNCTCLTALGTQMDIIPESIYTKRCPQAEYSVGEQVRHILDHYLMLLNGIASGHICYDKRERNQLLANSLSTATSTLDGILSKRLRKY